MQSQPLCQVSESAAPGWARWEPNVAAWMEPATEAMLDLAFVNHGKRVLDLASGAGSQTIRAAQRVGVQGHVVAIDIAESMLRHVQHNARSAGLTNVSTLTAAAEDLNVEADSFDAVICRLGLMLFTAPAQALTAVRRMLRPNGKFAGVVFTTPLANPFMAKPMEILNRYGKKKPPAQGRPGIFALGGPGVFQRLLQESGFTNIQEKILPVPLRMPSTEQALTMMKEAFGAFRAIVSDCPG